MGVCLGTELVLQAKLSNVFSKTLSSIADDVVALYFANVWTKIPVHETGYCIIFLSKGEPSRGTQLVSPVDSVPVHIYSLEGIKSLGVDISINNAFNPLSPGTPPPEFHKIFYTFYIVFFFIENENHFNLIDKPMARYIV